MSYFTAHFWPMPFASWWNERKKKHLPFPFHVIYSHDSSNTFTNTSIRELNLIQLICVTTDYVRFGYIYGVLFEENRNDKWLVSSATTRVMFLFEYILFSDVQIIPSKNQNSFVTNDKVTCTHKGHKASHNISQKWESFCVIQFRRRRNSHVHTS